MTSVAIGIDPSLCATGVAILGADGRVNAQCWKPAMRGVARLAWYRQRFEQVLAVHQGATVAVEGYAFGARNGREAAGELGGVLRLALHDAGLVDRVLVVPPAVLKKYVTGKGNADKAVMLLAVYKRWGFETADHNVADAYALARFAQAAAGPVDARTKAFAALLAKASRLA